MSRLNRTISFMAVASEITHIFCCGLPMIFSLLSLFASLGLTLGMPAAFHEFHEFMHVYEIPMMIVSLVIIIMGWALHYIALRLDCRSTGCGHGPCKPKKKRSAKILMVATLLFCLNISGYFLFHY